MVRAEKISLKFMEKKAGLHRLFLSYFMKTTTKIYYLIIDIFLVSVKLLAIILYTYIPLERFAPFKSTV